MASASQILARVDRANDLSTPAGQRLDNYRKRYSQIGARTWRALERMAYEGRTPKYAASDEGIRPGHFRRALASPIVQSALKEMERAARLGLRLEALYNIRDIAQDPTAKHATRLAANKYLAKDEEGAQSARGGGGVTVNVGVAVSAGEVIRPGMVVDLARPRPTRERYDDTAQLMEGQLPAQEDEGTADE